MKIVKAAQAGTVESSDIVVRIEPNESGVEILLTSSVQQQYGKRIEAVIRETLKELGVEAARIEAIDKGALDCTVKARTQAAAYRAAESTDYPWKQ
ncbi:MAG: citrate lyase acyl carrier protein [Clostridia bacterium]|nr:citrate lyase acyl carrier protein [Clostridia bacterium]MBQ5991837.1 citrate lyase acyl carrier protein [Clostridia bacterium]MDO4835225.1 citrate lyase acyl carrier protein [Clostridia bacterium]